MAISLVFFVLMLVEISGVFTANYPLKITVKSPVKVHEIMTLDENMLTFGTNDGSAPRDYEVYTVAIPGPKVRQETEQKINLRVKIDDILINLYLKPTDGYLATKNTPVWSVHTDPMAYGNIRYDPLQNAMREIGEFKMYQDVDNGAAVVVYTNPDGSFMMEGIVTSRYAIKSLPARLWNETLKFDCNRYLVETPMMGKRSIEPNVDEVTGYFVLYEIPPSSKDVIRSAPTYNHREKRQRAPLRSVGAQRRRFPKVVYPQILVVLDHNAIRDQSITEALRFALTFWNGVDMVYSALNEPYVRLNIAGIIISADDAATPYIAEDTSIQVIENGNRITPAIGMYFYNERSRFPLGQYDLIMTMTTMTLCKKGVFPCQSFRGAAGCNGTCSSEHRVTRDKRIRSTAVISYNWMFGGVDTAIYTSAHLFGVKDDKDTGITVACDYMKGFAMSGGSRYNHQNFKWSPCSIEFFRLYFSSKDSECLDNEPILTTSVDELWPGRWLTLDGQCRNAGAQKSCEFGEYPICVKKGCVFENSDRCFRSILKPLPGSKCDENKHCNKWSACVSESEQI